MFFDTTHNYLVSKLSRQQWSAPMKETDCEDSSYTVGTNTTDGTVVITIKHSDGTMTMNISSDETRYLIKMLELCANRVDELFNKDSN